MGVNTSTDVFKFYRYTPSVAAAIVCIVLFSLTIALHTFQLFRTCSWILIPLVLGGYGEVFGYVCRIFSSKQAPNYTLGLFIMQGTGTLLAPVLFAASIYMGFGRIVVATGGEYLSLVKPPRLTALFVAGDVTGLVIQGIGAAIMPLGTLKDYYIGEKIIIAGLALMVVPFGIFLLVSFNFQLRLSKSPTRRSIYLSSCPLNWRKDLSVLYISSAFIFIRSIFRLVEYSQGNAGWLLRHEWTLYTFDAALTFAVLVLFNLVHPSRINALML